jgi:hypothetical protein
VSFEDWERVKAVLTDEEWQAIERHSRYSGIEPRDYLRGIIVGGRVVPIWILEELIAKQAQDRK